MTANYTPDQIRTLSGRELDRAVSVLCFNDDLRAGDDRDRICDALQYATPPIGRSAFWRRPSYRMEVWDARKAAGLNGQLENDVAKWRAEPPPFSTDFNRTKLLFEEGGPLAPTSRGMYVVGPATDGTHRVIEIGKLLIGATGGVPDVIRNAGVATGPDMLTAACRAACIVALERQA